MKSLGEIYWDIDHECLHSDKIISFSEENMMLFHAAEEYVEELQKHGDRWRSIVMHDIDYLKASSFVRREQEGYSQGAEIFLSFVYKELERYGLKIDDGDMSPVEETTQPENIPETGNNECPNTGEDSGEKGETKPLTTEEIKEKLKKIDPFIQCGDGDDGGDGDRGDDDINTLPPDMIGIFKSLDDYKTFINDCRNLHKPRQIVGRLLDVPNLSLDYGNIDTLHTHLKSKGIIKLEYSSFCRVIREELKA